MGFQELLGNDRLKDELRQSLRSGHGAHFYMISGPEGSGKRTLARLLAQALAKELDIPCVQALHRFRHTPPQSRLKGAAQRRANVLGVYRAVNRNDIKGKRILLLDDVVTTGATASECAKILLLAGAKEVYFAAVAAASHDKK